jgi:hypothetical protein
LHKLFYNRKTKNYHGYSMVQDTIFSIKSIISVDIYYVL